MSNHDHFHDLIQDLNRPRPWTCTVEKGLNDVTCHQFWVSVKLRYRDEMRNHGA